MLESYCGIAKRWYEAICQPSKLSDDYCCNTSSIRSLVKGVLHCHWHEWYDLSTMFECHALLSNGKELSELGSCLISYKHEQSREKNLNDAK